MFSHTQIHTWNIYILFATWVALTWDNSYFFFFICEINASVIFSFRLIHKKLMQIYSIWNVQHMKFIMAQQYERTPPGSEENETRKALTSVISWDNSSGMVSVRMSYRKQTLSRFRRAKMTGWREVISDVRMLSSVTKWNTTCTSHRLECFVMYTSPVWRRAVFSC